MLRQLPQPTFLSHRDGMTRGEAEQLVKEAVARAMSRDGASGGVIRCVTVHAGGAERSLVLPEVPGRRVADTWCLAQHMCVVCR